MKPTLTLNITTEDKADGDGLTARVNVEIGTDDVKQALEAISLGITSLVKSAAAIGERLGLPPALIGAFLQEMTSRTTTNVSTHEDPNRSACDCHACQQIVNG